MWRVRGGRAVWAAACAAVMLILLGVPSSSGAAPQVSLESAAAFDRDAVGPASAALARNDVATARRLAPDVRRAFDGLPPLLQAAQATTVQRLARQYMARALHGEAVLLLEGAVAALERRAPVGGESLALVLADLARAHRLGGRPADADRLLARAQTLRPASPADPDTYPIQSELVERRREQGDLAGAEALLRPVLEAAGRMQGWEYVPNLVGVYEAAAAVATQRGRSEEARQYAQRAETIRRSMAAAEEQLRQFR